METSRVKLFVIFNSFQHTTLAVLSLHLSILKRHSLKSKIGVTAAIILGNSLVLVQERNP